MRTVVLPPVDPSYAGRSLAISEEEDDPAVREKYRPFLLDPEITASDWVSRLELSTALKMAEADIQTTGERLRVVVLYGSLRKRSYSKLLAFEASRILFRLGCDVRVFDPTGLPVKDDDQHQHPKVQELRDLSSWSDGHVWISPEQHGTLTAVFKNQIDWIPLSVGSVRPTQGRTSSVPMAYKQFTDADANDPVEGSSRMIPSGNRERIVDCMEEFVKYTIVMRPCFALFSDRYSERQERAAKELALRQKQDAEVANGVDVGKV
ncbi:arsenic resistance protein [Rutstroemia sp. NJR-2017a BBW]|nr:arsenic resistance protein [Rutstroemia sp. NJR-2017a BBW]